MKYIRYDDVTLTVSLRCFLVGIHTFQGVT